MDREIKAPIDKETARSLQAGDYVKITGTIYTARDAAHRRFFELLDAGKTLPFPLKGACIYYAGPTQARPGMPVGSCGPTTAGRMDRFAPRLLDLGLAAMIGKGQRNSQVREAVRRNRAVYFCALGGAGALACQCIRSCEVVAFEDLGCESVKKMEIEDFPLIVGIDPEGHDLFTMRTQPI